jgi:signal transduction histidine kinase
LNNAIKHTSEGLISVSIAKEMDADHESTKSNQNVFVSIKDTGAGISPQMFPKLFTKFGTDSGTGLGLYVSKNIIEAHGGKMSAENNKDGIGATFTFSLPLGQEKTEGINHDSIA